MGLFPEWEAQRKTEIEFWESVPSRVHAQRKIFGVGAGKCEGCVHLVKISQGKNMKVVCGKYGRGTSEWNAQWPACGLYKKDEANGQESAGSPEGHQDEGRSGADHLPEWRPADD